MAITYTSVSVSKPKGTTTPAATLAYSDLVKYIKYWHKEVGPLLAKARSTIDIWRTAGRPHKHITDVLFDIVVTFGEGKRFVWPQVNGHLLSAGEAGANTAIAGIDSTIGTLNKPIISSHFKALRVIKGLGKPPYGSKVLRCLSDDHVVFDSRIEDELLEADYFGFRQKCSDIAAALGGGFSAADVEGGLFVWVQLLLPKGKGHARWKKYSVKTATSGHITKITGSIKNDLGDLKQVDEVPTETKNPPPNNLPHKVAPSSRSKRPTISIRNAGAAFYAIHEGAHKTGVNIGYVGKGITNLGRGGHIVAYDRLQALLALAGYPSAVYPTPLSIPPFAGKPPGTTSFTIETHGLPIAPIGGPGNTPLPNTCLKTGRNVHSGFWFLEQFFDVIY